MFIVFQETGSIVIFFVEVEVYSIECIYLFVFLNWIEYLVFFIRKFYRYYGFGIF